MGSCRSREVIPEDPQKTRINAAIDADLSELATLGLTTKQILDCLTGILYLDDIKKRPEYATPDHPKRKVASETKKKKDGVDPPDYDTVSLSEHTTDTDPPDYDDAIKISKRAVSFASDCTDDKDSTATAGSKYTVTSKLHNGEDKCLLCKKWIKIICYSIRRGGETLKFELMALHYIGYHNFFNLRLSGNERSDIKDIVRFLGVKPGKSYYMKKETCKVWKLFDPDVSTVVGTYKIPGTIITVRICVSAKVLKENKEYFISKYLPHYVGDSYDYILAQIRECNIKKLLKEPRFFISPVLPLPRSISAEAYDKRFCGYYAKRFSIYSCYKRCEFWPDYLSEVVFAKHRTPPK